MITPLLLLLVVVLYRVVLGMAGSNDVQWLHNFSPIAAIALCGAVYLPKRIALALPLAMLFASDLMLNLFHYHRPLLTFEIIPRYVALVLITGIGFALRGRAQLPKMVGASVVGSIIFYLITNTGSWLAEPAYAKTAAGWVQALTTGLPGWPSTWWFYRHTLLSDVIFTLLFVGCMSLRSRKRDQLVPAKAGPASALST